MEDSVRGESEIDAQPVVRVVIAVENNVMEIYCNRLKVEDLDDLMRTLTVYRRIMRAAEPTAGGHELAASRTVARDE